MTSTSVLALDERIWRIAAIAQPRTARRFDNRAVNINSSPIATSTGHEIDVQASCGYTGHTPLRTLTPSPTAHSGVQVPRWQAVWAGLRRLRVPLGHALHQKAQRGRWFARPRRCWGGTSTDYSRLACESQESGDSHEVRIPGIGNIHDTVSELSRKFQLPRESSDASGMRTKGRGSR